LLIKNSIIQENIKIDYTRNTAIGHYF